jgi:SAM-dependent methyltransferase
MRETQKQVDALYERHITPGAGDPYHAVFPEFCQRCAKIPNCRVLEIGSREVSGNSRRQHFKQAAQYIGFDFHNGPGVDVTGDAHDLSSHFAPGSFDAVFSFSVFEHLAFPWKVAMEINRVLRIGGLCYVSTHPVWPPHELPWDFWRFPVAGLKLLFSAAIGFQTLVATDGLPAKIHSLVDDPPTRGISKYKLPLAVALIAEKTADYDPDRLRWDIPLESVLDTVYPQPK